MLKKMNTLNIKDIDLNRVQNNVERALNPIIQNPVLDYNIVNDVDLIIGDNLVNHKLGRKPIGWFLVRKRGPAEIYDKQDSNSTPSVNFILNSDANVNVDIYFF